MSVEVVAVIVPILLTARFFLTTDLGAQVRGAIFVILCVVGLIGRHMDQVDDLGLIFAAVVLCGSIILAVAQRVQGVDDE